MHTEDQTANLFGMYIFTSATNS